MYRRILVATDGSAPAARALDEAIELARGQNAKLRIVHVVDEGLVLPAEFPSANLAEVEQKLRTDGEALLKAALARARDAGVDAETVLVEEMGWQSGPAIVEQAANWPADLIVCGTHGRRGIGRLLLGSDSEYVVRHTPVPVLLLRAGAPLEEPDARDTGARGRRAGGTFAPTDPAAG
jgi:nucleotide-binding universal stress UspA family protein